MLEIRACLLAVYFFCKKLTQNTILQAKSIINIELFDELIEF